MQCPKCGRVAAKGAFICAGCDFILDTSFLGDDITDDERDQRALRRPERPRVDFGEDAMILGNPAENDVSEFRSRDAGVSQREVTQARFYIGGIIGQLMQDNAVPELVVTDAHTLRLTPFERHVLGFVNGKRSVGRIAKKAAMEESEFKTALAMLADKGFLRLKGFKRQRPPAAPPEANVGDASLMSARRPLEGERTVVASVEHIESLARAASSSSPMVARRPDRVRPLSSFEGSAPVTPSPGSTPASTPLSDLARPPSLSPRTRARSAAPSADQSAVVTVPMTLRARSEQLSSLLDAAPEDVLSVLPQPVAAPAPDADGFDADQPTRVAVPADAHAHPTRLLDDEPGDPDDCAQDDPVAGDASAAAWARLRDSTGLGDPFLEDAGPEDGGPLDAGEGDPGDDDYVVQDDPGDDELAGEDDNGGDEWGPDANAVEAQADGFHALATGTHDRGISSALTRSLPAEPAADDAEAAPDEDDGDKDERDDDDDQHDDDRPTREIAGVVTVPQAAPPPVPTALSTPERVLPVDHPFAAPRAPVPLPGGVRGGAAALAPLPRHSAPTTPLPGQGAAVTPLPGQGPAAPPSSPSLVAPVTDPAPATSRTAAPTWPSPGLVALPGQAMPAQGKPSGAPPSPAPSPAPAPSSAAGPASSALLGTRLPGPPRVSAASKVPFELRKKAERIYEQALKDRAEGRLASAVMNAKLAMSFDPTVPAYPALHEELVRARGAAAAPRAVRGELPRELALFEQANEAEGRGEYEKAAKLLREAIELNPKAAALHNKIGVVLSIRLKRHEEALAHLKQAVDLEPGSVVYMNNFS
ncbi:MAG: tetratricopeptide repeat protein, partial [Deltaproteobacteria bacterium]|nr:tetratricopeptide repeat protein [Deltaproteobacteria bacterium]